MVVADKLITYGLICNNQLLSIGVCMVRYIVWGIVGLWAHFPLGVILFGIFVLWVFKHHAGRRPGQRVQNYLTSERKLKQFVRAGRLMRKFGLRGPF